jgi:hypothetical protein
MKLTFTNGPMGTGLLVNDGNDMLNIVPDGDGGHLVYHNGTLMGGIGIPYNS